MFLSFLYVRELQKSDELSIMEKAASFLGHNTTLVLVTLLPLLPFS